MSFLKNLFDSRSDAEKAEIIGALSTESVEVNAGGDETDMDKETLDAFNAKFEAMQAQLDKSDADKAALEAQVKAFVDKTGNEINAKGNEFANDLIGGKYFAASAKEDLSGLFIALKDIEVSMGADAPQVNGKSITDCMSALFAKDGPADLARRAFNDEDPEMSADEELTVLGQRFDSRKDAEGLMSDEEIKAVAGKGASTHR